jgi:hypothetical protein
MIVHFRVRARLNISRRRRAGGNGLAEAFQRSSQRERSEAAGVHISVMKLGGVAMDRQRP